jgi:hypothetical protein
VAPLLKQFAHELRGRPRVAPPLRQQVENRAFVVDRSPEPEMFAADQNRHFIEVQCEVGRGRRRRSSSANTGPNFNTHRLTVS